MAMVSHYFKLLIMQQSGTHRTNHDQEFCYDDDDDDDDDDTDDNQV